MWHGEANNMLVIESMLCKIYIFLYCICVLCVCVGTYMIGVTCVIVQVAFCWSLPSFSTLGSGGLNSDRQVWWFTCWAVSLALVLFKIFNYILFCVCSSTWMPGFMLHLSNYSLSINSQESDIGIRTWMARGVTEKLPVTYVFSSSIQKRLR